jgi:glycosyltransferase involved in cell wall biosynthesis
MSHSLSVIVPAFNEERNLAAAVNTVREATADKVSDLEIIIVDDNSTDGTGPIADRLASEDGRIRVVHNPSNMGLGYNYRKGAALACREYVIMVPGDNENSSRSIQPVLEHLGEADLIVPYVVNPEVRPLARRVLSRLFVFIVNVLCGLRLRYYNGTCAIRREALEGLPIDTNGFAYMADTLVRLLKRGHSYKEVGVQLDQRVYGPSKAFAPRNVVQVGWAVLTLFWQVRVLRRA